MSPIAPALQEYFTQRLISQRQASPHTVAAYLAAMATTHTSSVLERRLATLSRAHRLAGLDWPRAHPAIRNTLRGIQREQGQAKTQAAALAPVPRPAIGIRRPRRGRQCPRPQSRESRSVFSCVNVSGRAFYM